MAGPLKAVLRSEDCGAGTPGQPAFHAVRVGGADLLVVRLDGGEVVAFSAECPHLSTPLEGATFWDGHLRCARHLYLYDVHTGENVLPAREAQPDAMWKLRPGYLAVHRAEERDGWIWVAETPEPPPPGYDAELERSPRAAAPPAAAPVPSGPVEHGPEAATVRVGEELELVLPTTPRPAHLWRASVASAVVAVVAEGFAPDPPARHMVRLVGRSVGEAEVRCTYATPWSGEPAECRTYLVRVLP